MLGLAIWPAVLVGSGALWVAGLRLFLRSEHSRRWKIGWTAFLALVGLGIGIVLPLPQIRGKFLLLLLGLPVLGMADVWLLRSGRGVWFWVRACGFEVCTVFGIASATRWLLDAVGVAAFGRQSG